MNGDRLKWGTYGARLFQPATDLTSPPFSCILSTAYDTCCFSAFSLWAWTHEKKKISSAWSWATRGGQTHHMCSPKLPTRSGRNYRFSKPEANAIHLHHREGLQRGFLSDLGLHAMADVSGPNHLEAQRLAPWWRDEGAPQVDAVADELRSDHRSGGQGRDSLWKQIWAVAEVTLIGFLFNFLQ